MPSLDFDTEKASFRDYYEENRPLLDDAIDSFGVLITSLINHAGNPFTVIRHCLYAGNKEVFSNILTNAAKESFERWLSENAWGGVSRITSCAPASVTSPNGKIS